jgi:hypothetical protein
MVHQVAMASSHRSDLSSRHLGAVEAVPNRLRVSQVHREAEARTLLKRLENQMQEIRGLRAVMGQLVHRRLRLHVTTVVAVVRAVQVSGGGTFAVTADQDDRRTFQVHSRTTAAEEAHPIVEMILVVWDHKDLAWVALVAEDVGAVQRRRRMAEIRRQVLERPVQQIRVAVVAAVHTLALRPVNRRRIVRAARVVLASLLSGTHSCRPGVRAHT